MTEEIPIRPKSEYTPHLPSEENGLVEDFEDSDPEYLLTPEEPDTGQRVDLGYFFDRKDTTGYVDQSF